MALSSVALILKRLAGVAATGILGATAFQAAQSFKPTAAFRMASPLPRRDIDARDTGAALRLRQDMPGLKKEDLNIWVDQNNKLNIKADWWYNSDEPDQDGVTYKGAIDLGISKVPLQTDKIKAELKNGVLKILIPKVDCSTPPQSLNHLIGMSAGGPRQDWHVMETDKGMRFRVDLPGLTDKDVKVSVEKDNLRIRGEWPYDEEEEATWMPYEEVVDLSLMEGGYKAGEIKTEMDDGVLKVVVPWLKEED